MTSAEWRQDEQGLHRTLEFGNFDEAWSFMEQVVTAARELDHHPDWSNSWNTVRITLISHDVGAVTDRDLALARTIDSLLDQTNPLGAKG